MLACQGTTVFTVQSTVRDGIRVPLYHDLHLYLDDVSWFTQGQKSGLFLHFSELGTFVLRNFFTVNNEKKISL